MLLPVMEFNLPGTLEKFAVIADAMGEMIDDLPLRDAAYLALEAVETLIEDCGIAAGLKALGIKEKDFPSLADVAMAVARPLANNPRGVTREDAIGMYRRAF
jgi:alcohol dehydrogenase